MTKKEERKYAKNREEYFREFHRVIAPVVVLKVEGKDEYPEENKGQCQSSMQDFFQSQKDQGI